MPGSNRLKFPTLFMNTSERWFL